MENILLNVQSKNDLLKLITKQIVKGLPFLGISYGTYKIVRDAWNQGANY